MTSQSNYSNLGVSASKEEVHAAIQHLDKGLYPNAFCKILPDLAAGNAKFCNLLHADTAGTKASLAYLYWCETGDMSVWANLAQDAIVMNLDDMACVGCVNDILLSSTIGRNKNLIPGPVLAELIRGASDFTKMLLEDLGIHVYLAGGETADVGDIVRTIDVGFTAFARMKRSEVILPNITSGDVIIGFASDGLASYENEYSAGVGANGFTLARHGMLLREYVKKYPESFDPKIRKLAYRGKYSLTERIELERQWSSYVGKFLLSPTRTYLPIVKAMLELPVFKGKGRQNIHGIIHCSGGGQTKVLKFAQGVNIIKDKLFPVPEIFNLIRKSSGTTWSEMYQVFNMGHRMEIYLPEQYAQQAIDVASKFQVRAKVIGHVKPAETTRVTIKSPHRTFVYE